MKLVIACLLAGSALADVAFTSDIPTTTVKKWCSAARTFDKITTIAPTTLGSVDEISLCKVKGGIAVTIDGSGIPSLPTTTIKKSASEASSSSSTLTDADEDEHVVNDEDAEEASKKKKESPAKNAPPTTVSLLDSVVGPRTIFSIKGAASHDAAKELVPFNVNIANNVFETDGHVFITGALPPFSTIAITGNKFTIARPLGARFPSGEALDTTAIAIALNDVFMWESAAVRITKNEINARDNKGRFALHAVSIREQLYWYGANATFDMTHNTINMKCHPDLYNNTNCAFGLYGDRTMYMYMRDSYFTVDHNRFNVTGGLFYKMPNFLSHLASGRISASYNKGFSYSPKNPTACAVRRYTPFTEFGLLNLGAQTYVNVDYNTFRCEGKAGVLGFPTDLTATDHVFVSIRGNEILTKGCSPSIYFMNTFSLTQKAVLWIDSNVNSRADILTSGLASVYFAGEFAVQHDAEFTVSNNIFGRARTVKPKTKMVGLAPSAINSWRVEDTATISMCGNTYNGKPVHEEDELKPHIALKMQEVVLVDRCRTERRPHSEDYEPGGADDIIHEVHEFGEDQAMEYTRAVIPEAAPETDPDTALDDEGGSSKPVAKEAAAATIDAQSEL